MFGVILFKRLSRSWRQPFSHNMLFWCFDYLWSFAFLGLTEPKFIYNIHEMCNNLFPLKGSEGASRIGSASQLSSPISYSFNHETKFQLNTCPFSRQYLELSCNKAIILNSKFEKYSIQIFQYSKYWGLVLI